MMAPMRASSVGITSGDLEAAGAKETRVIDRGRQQRPSVFDVVKARVGTSAEKQGFCPYFRAAVALYGSICFWVGAWSIIDHQLNGVCFLLGQHLRDIAIGVAMLIASDTYYQVGFVYGSMLPPLIKQLVPNVRPNEELPLWGQRLCFAVVQVRVIVGISGSVFMWNGLYNSLYYVVPEDQIMRWLQEDNLNNARLIKLTTCLFVGILLVCISGTLLATSGVPHVLTDEGESTTRACCVALFARPLSICLHCHCRRRRRHCRCCRCRRRSAHPAMGLTAEGTLQGLCHFHRLHSRAGARRWAGGTFAIGQAKA